MLYVKNPMGKECGVDKVGMNVDFWHGEFRISLSVRNSDWPRPEANPASQGTWGGDQFKQLLPRGSLIRLGGKWEGRVDKSPPPK